MVGPVDGALRHVFVAVRDGVVNAAGKKLLAPRAGEVGESAADRGDGAWSVGVADGREEEHWFAKVSGRRER